VQYNLLAREADTNRSLYEGLLQRYKELNAAAGISASNIAIIDLADNPTEPSSPKLLRNFALALAVGVVLAASIVFLRYQFDDAVRVPEDIELKLGMPLLGVIPKALEGRPVDAMADPKSALSEGYNSLRSSLLYSTAGGLPRTLLITSSQPAEGKSTSSVAVARSLARLGRKVVLIDVDLRRPALHAQFAVPNEHGMSTLLTANDTLDEVLQPSGQDNLAVITSGPIPPSPTELLSSNGFQHMLQELRNRFDVVILDSPPVLGLADAPLISAMVDAVVLIVQSDRGRRGRCAPRFAACAPCIPTFWVRC
jgi:capsular exopolysaccharide synthesis family protein